MRTKKWEIRIHAQTQKFQMNGVCNYRLSALMAAPWWSSTEMETDTRCWPELKPGGRKAECSGLLPLYTQKSSQ